jgi:hypothetical protein
VLLQKLDSSLFLPLSEILSKECYDLFKLRVNLGPFRKGLHLDDFLEFLVDQVVLHDKEVFHKLLYKPKYHVIW